MSLITVKGNAKAEAPKPQREGKQDRFALFIGPMWSSDINGQHHGTFVKTDLQFFMLLPEALRYDSLSPRVAH